MTPNILKSKTDTSKFLGENAKPANSAEHDPTNNNYRNYNPVSASADNNERDGAKTDSLLSSTLKSAASTTASSDQTDKGQSLETQAFAEGARTANTALDGEGVLFEQGHSGR